MGIWCMFMTYVNRCREAEFLYHVLLFRLNIMMFHVNKMASLYVFIHSEFQVKHASLIYECKTFEIKL